MSDPENPQTPANNPDAEPNTPAPNPEKPEATGEKPTTGTEENPTTEDGNPQTPDADEGNSGEKKTFLEKMFGSKNPNEEQTSMLQKFEEQHKKDQELFEQQAKEIQDLQNGVLPKSVAEKAFQHLQSENDALKAQLATMSQDFNTFKEELAKGKGLPSGQSPFNSGQETQVDLTEVHLKRKQLF